MVCIIFATTASGTSNPGASPASCLRSMMASTFCESHLKPISKFFGDRRAVDVTAKLVDDYIDDRLAGDRKAGIRPRASATVNRETQLLGQAFSLGIERRVIVSAPHIRHLPERNTRSGFFERAEFETVVSHLPE